MSSSRSGDDGTDDDDDEGASVLDNVMGFGVALVGVVARLVGEEAMGSGWTIGAREWMVE